MTILALTATDAAAWTGLVTAIVGGVLAIIGALKGFSASGKADVLNDRANALANHAQSLDRQITEVAAQQPPSIAAASPLAQAPASDQPKG